MGREEGNEKSVGCKRMGSRRLYAFGGVGDGVPREDYCNVQGETPVKYQYSW